MHTLVTMSCATVIALIAAGAAARAQDVAPGTPVEPPRKGLRIDIGRFTPSGRGVVVEVGERAPGDGVRVDVEAHSPNGARGVHVDVDTGAARHGGRVVDVQLSRVRGGAPIEVRAPGAATETYLGVSTQPLPPAIADQLGDLLPEGGALLVTDVVPDSPAAEAGLRRHDVLVLYGDESVTTPERLKELVTHDRGGERVTLEIIRGAKQRTVEAVLKERAIAGSVVSELSPPEEVTPVLGESQAGPELSNGNSQPVVQQRAGRTEPPLPEAPTGDEAGSEAIAPPPQRTAVRPEPPAAGAAVALPPDRGVNVSTPDGRFFRVEIRYVDRAGRPQVLQFEGTKLDIRQQVDAVPAEVKADVKRSVEGI